MQTFRYQFHIIRLGKKVEEIHAKADAKFYKGILDSSDGGWMRYVDKYMLRLPEVVQLKGRADRAMMRFAEESGAIDKAYNSDANLASVILYAIFQHPFGVLANAIQAIYNAIRGVRETNRLVESSRVYQACAMALRNYKLVSVLPSGRALVRGTWHYRDIGRNTTTACDAGISLNTQIRIKRFGRYEVVRR